MRDSARVTDASPPQHLPNHIQCPASGFTCPPGTQSPSSVGISLSCHVDCKLGGTRSVCLRSVHNRPLRARSCGYVAKPNRADLGYLMRNLTTYIATKKADRGLRTQAAEGTEIVRTSAVKRALKARKRAMIHFLALMSTLGRWFRGSLADLTELNEIGSHNNTTPAQKRVATNARTSSDAVPNGSPGATHPEEKTSDTELRLNRGVRKHKYTRAESTEMWPNAES